MCFVPKPVNFIVIVTHVTYSYIVIHTAEQTLIFKLYVIYHLIHKSVVRDKSVGIKFSVQPVFELLG